MKIQNIKDEKQVVTLGLWGNQNGQPPRQTIKPIGTTVITFTDDKGKKHENITVSHNQSKSKVDYYYLQIDGKWYWSRTPMPKGDYQAYTKPVVEKPAKETKTKTDGASKAGDGANASVKSNAPADGKTTGGGKQLNPPPAPPNKTTQKSPIPKPSEK